MTSNTLEKIRLHQAQSPLAFPESPLSQIAAQPMMIGLFLPTQTGGFSQSKLPRGTQWSFDYNKDLTLKAESYGFDFVFAALPEHVLQIRQAYAKTGRSGKVIIFPLIVCKKTREEAYAYRDAIVAEADLESIAAYTNRHAKGDAQGWPKHVPADRVLGGHIQIVGDPNDVADAITKLHEAGLDGIQIGFYDYGPDLDFFAEAVLPLLEKRGLRRPRS